MFSACFCHLDLSSHGEKRADADLWFNLYEENIQNSSDNSPLELLFSCGDISWGCRQPSHVQVTILEVLCQVWWIILRIDRNRVCLRGIWTLYKTRLGSDLGHFFSSRREGKRSSFNADFLLWWHISFVTVVTWRILQLRLFHQSSAGHSGLVLGTFVNVPSYLCTPPTLAGSFFPPPFPC